jgi:hypothetical protein
VTAFGQNRSVRRPITEDFGNRLVAELRRRARRQLQRRLVVNALHRAFYYAGLHRGLAWYATSWLGVPAWKCHLDLWIYQEILAASSSTSSASTCATTTAGGRTARLLSSRHERTAAVAVARSDPAAPPPGVHRRDLLGGLIHEYELGGEPGRDYRRQRVRLGPGFVSKERLGSLSLNGQETSPGCRGSAGAAACRVSPPCLARVSACARPARLAEGSPAFHHFPFRARRQGSPLVLLGVLALD